MGIWAEIKHALNRSLGSSSFMSLDEIIGLLTTKIMNEFDTPGTYQLVIPPGVHNIKVTACGAGGGGSYGEDGAGGGGGAAIVDKIYDVIPLSIIEIIIGKGGMGAYRGDGGSTVIGNIVTLPGGYRAPMYRGGGDAGGTGGGKGGAKGQKGNDGIIGTGGSASDTTGGGGGGSLGYGGEGSTSSAGDGVKGGGGGGSTSTNSFFAGDGGNGYAKIEFVR